MKNWMLIVLCFLLLNNTLIAQKKIPVVELLKDYDQLTKLLKEEHQGLYYYVDSATANHYLDSLRASIKVPMTLEEFYSKVLAATAATNEGHTSAFLPKKYRKNYKKQDHFLPIELQFAGEEAIVVGYYGKEEASLKRGDKILSINGKSIPEIMQKVQKHLATDGFNTTSLYEWTSWSFPVYYELFYGKASHFEVEIEPLGSKVPQKIKLAAVAATEMKSANNQLPSLQVEEVFKIEQLKAGVAYLQVPNFYSHKDFEGFYKKAFTQIKAWNIQHLILDIQHNGGGEEGNENLLASYLIEQPFQKYKAVLVKKELYQKKKNSKGFLEDKWRIKEGQPCRGEFTLQSDYYSNLGYQKPTSDLIYKGQLYILTSGLTFSGGAEFASMIKMNNRATFIGEEVGGAYEGNVSGYSKQVKLSCTKIIVQIPLVHFQINVQPSIKGHGVLPDYKVITDQAAITKGENAKLNFAVELIDNKKE